MIDLKKPTKEEIAEGLKLLQKKKEYEGKVQRGEPKGTKKRGDYTPEEQRVAKLKEKKRVIRQKLILAKAALAGIGVSEEEIDSEMKALKQ